MAEASPSDPTVVAPETPVQTRRRWALFLGLAGTIVVIDQLTKLWVDASFEVASRRVPAGQPGGPTEIVGDLVRIAKTYNDGAIFGLLEASAPILALVTLGVVAAIVWYEWRHGASAGPLVTGGLGILLGGAIGNLIDRIRLGHVVDFVDMGIGSLRWYAYNVSDAAVFIGILLLFAAALLGDRAIPARRRMAAGPAEAGRAPGAATSNDGPAPPASS